MGIIPGGMRSGWATTGMLLAGALSGIATATGAAWFLNSRPPSTQHAEVALAATERTPTTRFILTRTSEATAPSGEQSPAAGPRQSEGTGSEPMSAAWSPEGVARTLATEARRMSERVAAHASEPVDANWAKLAQDSIESHFAKATSGLAAKLKDVECRSVTCVAHFDWPAGSAAKGELPNVMIELGQAAPDAVRHLTLNGGSEAGSATAVLDWTQSRNVSKEN